MTARCAGQHRLFQSTDRRDHEQARQMCATDTDDPCPALAACRATLRQALTDSTGGAAGAPAGTWAGRLYVEGRSRTSAGEAAAMSPDDPRHGTTAGHYAHRKDGEPACGPCVAAKTRYEKTRHVYGPRMVPATGTRRRIQALKAMGHSGADIAAALGVTYQAVNRLEHSTSAHIFAATQANVARVYEEMCMTLPTGYHRTRIRNAAARAGYAPPLAWDDIDTDPQPVGWQYQPRAASPAPTPSPSSTTSATGSATPADGSRSPASRWRSGARGTGWVRSTAGSWTARPCGTGATGGLRGVPRDLGLRLVRPTRHPQLRGLPVARRVRLPAPGARICAGQGRFCGRIGDRKRPRIRANGPGPTDHPS